MSEEMWIELHDSVRDHPKIKRLARDCHVTVAHGLGLMCSLWTWTLRMSPDGDLGSFLDEDIEDGAGWEGDTGVFIKSAIKNGLLDRDSSGITVHDWSVYAARLKARVRKRSERARKKGLSRDTSILKTQNVTVTLTDQTDQTDQTRPDREDHTRARDCEKNTTQEVVHCAALDDLPDATYEHKEYVWQNVIADWVTISGLPHDAQTNREPAEAILRLAKSVTPNNPGKSVRKALNAWMRDEWVRKNRPPITNLVKFFDRHVSDAPKIEDKPTKEYERREVYERDSRTFDEKQKRDIERYEREQREGKSVPTGVADVVKQLKRKQLKNL